MAVDVVGQHSFLLVEKWPEEAIKNQVYITLKLLLIAATNFGDFSEKPHNR